jgi:hypothetical protein
LPEDVDSSEEELFRQQIRDLAFTVITQQIIHFIGHYETNSPNSTDGIVGYFNAASFSLMYQFNNIVWARIISYIITSKYIHLILL